MQDMTGGFMGLELPLCGNFPHAESPCCAWVGSGRAALWVLLRHLPRPRRLLVPRFMCDTVLQAPARLGIPVARYACDDQLRPLLPDDLCAEDTLLVADYFGLTGTAAGQAAACHAGVSVLDATTALFTRSALPAFYSPRKFCGTADGGVAKAPFPLPQLPERQDSSAGKSLFLLQRLESGAAAALPASQAAEEALNGEPRRMSPLTRRLLQAYDFAEIARRRTENYTALHRRLRDINRLELPDTPPSAPFCYPLASGIPGLRDALVDAGVAIPLLWPEVIEATPAHSAENRLARTLLPLPLDQRYSPADMERLADLILGV